MENVIFTILICTQRMCLRYKFTHVYKAIVVSGSLVLSLIGILSNMNSLMVLRIPGRSEGSTTLSAFTLFLSYMSLFDVL